MKSKPFTLDSLGKTRRASASTHAKKAAPKRVVTKPTKHGRAINAILDELSKFEWDFEAMKRV